MSKRKITKMLLFECILGGVFSAFVGYLLSAGMGPGVTLIPWLDYQAATVFKDPPRSFFHNYYNGVYTIRMVLLAIALYLFLLLAWRLNQHNLMINKTFGSAEWGNIDAINARIMDKGVDSKGKKRPDDKFYYVIDGILHTGRYRAAGKERGKGK